MELGHTSSPIRGTIAADWQAGASGAVELPAQRKLGVGVYTRASLAQYDLGVVKLSCTLLWRCPGRVIEAHYARNVSANHLDVGVGTGYFLDRVAFPAAAPSLALFDLSENSLTFTAARLARYRPLTVQGDVLRPLGRPIGEFDSIGMNFLLHCLPGPMSRKAAAFDTIAPALRPGGTLFGATLVTSGRGIPIQARAWMRMYNAAGIFGNATDSADELRTELGARFDDVHVEMRGAMALFTARGR